MSKVKIVVTCVAGTVSGGPEALHQLVDMVNQIEPGAGAICYAPYEGVHRKFPQYDKYDTPIIMKDKIPHDAVVVFPEILPDHGLQFPQRKALWWLSVDNFVKDHTQYLEMFSYHLTQSEYAREYVKSIGYESIMLTDYINDVFESNSNLSKDSFICVNPSKGGHLIKEFKNNNLDYNIIELSQMDRETVKSNLSRSKIYIDFGHHPGRDRFPREAVLSDCVLLATNYGAAKNDVDIPIDSWYKFDSMDLVREKVDEIVSNYQQHLNAQSNYKNNILKQKEIFKLEVSKLLELASL